MSKFIFVSGSYDPFPTANAVCAKAIEEALKERGHEVIYVVTRHDIGQELTEQINGNRVFFVPRPVQEVHWSFSRLSQSFLTYTTEKYFIQALHLLVRFGLKLLALLRGKSTREAAIGIFRANFITILSRLLKQEKPDCVVTFSVPFHNHLYTLDAFNKSGRRSAWISVLLDAHKQQAEAPETRKLILGGEEQRVFEGSDKCFLLNVLRDSYYTPEYQGHLKKFYFFRLPFLQIPLTISAITNSGITKAENCLAVTFAGTLYDNNRPIDYLCSFIRSFKNLRVHFHFMGKFHAGVFSQLASLTREMPDQVFIYGLKNREFVLASLQRSDMLINIGNNNTNQIPSKILEYIGMLKPIISFIREKNDASFEYLHRYPYSFIIDEQDKTPLPVIVKNVLGFYQRCVNEEVSVELIRKQFEGYLQEDVTGEIAKIIEDVIYARKKD